MDLQNLNAFMRNVEYTFSPSNWKALLILGSTILCSTTAMYSILLLCGEHCRMIISSNLNSLSGFEYPFLQYQSSRSASFCVLGNSGDPFLTSLVSVRSSALLWNRWSWGAIIISQAVVSFPGTLQSRVNRRTLLPLLSEKIFSWETRCVWSIWLNFMTTFCW